MKQRSYRFATSLVWLCWAGSIFCFEAGAAETECPPIRDAQSLVDCVKLRHPDLQRVNAEHEVKLAQIRVAAQRPNPSVESRVLFGIDDHPSPALSETNFFQPIELGGKRGARMEKARAEAETSFAGFRLNAEEAVLQTILRLHRLRQIRAERRTLSETTATYSRIAGLYRGRPLLSPEQESSLVIFETAMSETRLHQVELGNEEQALGSEVRLAVGEELEVGPSLLPSTPKSWPLRSEGSPAPENTAAVQQARSEVESARASSRLARSEAWPTLRVGPSIETDSPAGNNQTAVGFIFSTDLPFYNRNQGGKAVALQEERLAKLKLEQEETRAQAAMKRWSLEYTRNREAVLRASRGSGFSASHRRLEELFDRGLIPGTLLLEAHRQMIDLQLELHKAELKALEAWWRLIALDGKILEAKL